MIELKKTHLEEINRYSEAEYPDECCGILVGKIATDRSKHVEFIIPISNAREQENKHHRFLITADELRRAELFARQNKLDVVGFYHSHPDHPAKPSEYDREYAWPSYSYIIVSVISGKAENFTSWELAHDRSVFNSEPINKGD